MAVIKKITEGKMNCNRARSLLNSYIDNKLDLRTAYQLAVHVESCSRCREELETSYIINKAIVEMESVDDVTLDYIGALNNKLEATQREFKNREIYLKVKRITLMILAIAILVLSTIGIGTLTSISMSDKTSEYDKIVEISEKYTKDLNAALSKESLLRAWRIDIKEMLHEEYKQRVVKEYKAAMFINSKRMELWLEPGLSEDILECIEMRVIEINNLMRRLLEK